MPKGILLCIEDDPDTLSQYERIFTARGYKVLTGENGFDLGCLASDEKWDAIILDIKMPGLDGLTSVERLSTHFPQYLNKIITVSGHIDENIEDKLKSHNIDFIRKPADFNILTEKIEKIIVNSQREKLERQKQAVRKLKQTG